ncbi:hypothetical protein R3P38DRAFT_1837063 [Favolaschia claudopus]|uniref:Uncharacterized protein n=1 Tax=Favolaschia claudopus TaxID=2862362 RepID=A0AAW0A3Q4_9AGAR
MSSIRETNYVHDIKALAQYPDAEGELEIFLTVHAGHWGIAWPVWAPGVARSPHNQAGYKYIDILPDTNNNFAFRLSIRLNGANTVRRWNKFPVGTLGLLDRGLLIEIGKSDDTVAIETSGTEAGDCRRCVANTLIMMTKKRIARGRLSEQAVRAAIATANSLV